MAQARTLPGARVHPGSRQAPAASGGGRRGWGIRLWCLLHAQAILDGSSGGPHDVAFIEDDRQRLSGPRTGDRRPR